MSGMAANDAEIDGSVVAKCNVPVAHYIVDFVTHSIIRVFVFEAKAGKDDAAIFLVWRSGVPSRVGASKSTLLGVAVIDFVVFEGDELSRSRRVELSFRGGLPRARITCGGRITGCGGGVEAGERRSYRCGQFSDDRGRSRQSLRFTLRKA